MCTIMGLFVFNAMFPKNARFPKIVCSGSSRSSRRWSSVLTESCSTSRSRMLSSRLLAMVMLIVSMSLDWTSNRQNCKCSHLYPSGCSWYDQVICDGEVVRDLYRWWFQSRCSNSRWTVGETSSSNCDHIHPCLTKSILSSSECLWSLDLGPKWDQIQGLDRNCLYQVMSHTKISLCYKMLLYQGKEIVPS